jgi:hypothetical protein
VSHETNLKPMTTDQVSNEAAARATDAAAAGATTPGPWAKRADGGGGAIGCEWRLATASCQGATHRHRGLNNQDNVAATGEGQLPLVLAVSDGHGSDKCFRSHRGSRFAVDVAKWYLTDALRALNPELHPVEALARLKNWLPRAISTEWRRQVAQDLEREPFNDEEIGKLRTARGEGAVQAVDRHPMLAYGATLVAAAVTDRLAVFLQLGDGDILIVDPAGKAEMVLGAGPSIGEETDSLSLEEAPSRVRMDVRPVRSPQSRLVELIMVSTDGYSKSYATDAEFARVATDVTAMIRTMGFESVEAQLPNWLESVTNEGAGDDVTVGLMWHPTALVAVNEKPSGESKTPIVSSVQEAPPQSSGGEEGAVETGSADKTRPADQTTAPAVAAATTPADAAESAQATEHAPLAEGLAEVAEQVPATEHAPDAEEPAEAVESAQATEHAPEAGEPALEAWSPATAAAELPATEVLAVPADAGDALVPAPDKATGPPPDEKPAAKAGADFVQTAPASSSDFQPYRTLRVTAEDLTKKPRPAPEAAAAVPPAPPSSGFDSNIETVPVVALSALPPSPETAAEAPFETSTGAGAAPPSTSAPTDDNAAAALAGAPAPGARHGRKTKQATRRQINDNSHNTNPPKRKRATETQAEQKTTGARGAMKPRKPE